MIVQIYEIRYNKPEKKRKCKNAKKKKKSKKKKARTQNYIHIVWYLASLL